LNFLASTRSELVPIQVKEWETVELLCNFLKPFQFATQRMSGERFPTLASVIPLFNILMDHLDDIETSTTCELLRDAAAACLAKLKEYYNKTSPKQCMVTLLDPRFNFKYFVEEKWPRNLTDPIKEQ
jgi:hypothetical protein